ERAGLRDRAGARHLDLRADRGAGGPGGAHAELPVRAHGDGLGGGGAGAAGGAGCHGDRVGLRVEEARDRAGQGTRRRAGAAAGARGRGVARDAAAGVRRGLPGHGRREEPCRRPDGGRGARAAARRDRDGGRGGRRAGERRRRDRDGVRRAVRQVGDRAGQLARGPGARLPAGGGGRGVAGDRGPAVIDGRGPGDAGRAVPGRGRDAGGRARGSCGGEDGDVATEFAVHGVQPVALRVQQHVLKIPAEGWEVDDRESPGTGIDRVDRRDTGVLGRDEEVAPVWGDGEPLLRLAEGRRDGVAVAQGVRLQQSAGSDGVRSDLRVIRRGRGVRGEHVHRATIGREPRRLRLHRCQGDGVEHGSARAVEQYQRVHGHDQ
ncbi:MAG: hypothetical protein RLZ84_431, partial [Actinomycetota bacterium]